LRLAKGLHRLQKVSSEAEETSEGSSAESEGLVGTGGGDWGWGWLDGRSGSWGSSSGWDTWVGGWLRGDNGGVGSWVSNWNVGWGNNGLGDNWLDDGAWAVGDGQSLAFSGSVGNAIVGQLGGSWADSGVSSVDLSGVDHGLVAVGSRGSCCDSKDGDGGELHFEFGWY